MALEMRVESPAGDDYPAAYLRVIRCFLDVDRRFTTATIGFYRDVDACKAGKAPFETRDFHIPDTDFGRLDPKVKGAPPNAVAAVYGHLKSIEPYDAAKDV